MRRFDPEEQNSKKRLSPPRWVWAAQLRFWLGAATFLVQPVHGEAQQQPVSLMRQKLSGVKDIVEGLTTRDFGKVKDAGQMLRTISVVDEITNRYTYEEYRRLAEDFRTGAEDLIRSAEDKDLDKATATFNRVIQSCVRCHNLLRDGVDAERPPPPPSETEIETVKPRDDRPVRSEVRFRQHFITRYASGASSVSAADMDGDGDLDVLSAARNEGKVSWHENDGRPDPFFREHTISTEIDGVESIITADLDGDEDIDLVAASSTEDRITWFENSGGRTPYFTPHTISSSVHGAKTLSVADVNGDGRLDVISCSAEDHRVVWHENQGGRPVSFVPHEVETTVDTPRAFVALDFDRDMDVDFIGAPATRPWIELFENDGKPRPSFTSRRIGVSSFGPRAIASADIDGDDDLDLILAGEQRLETASETRLGPTLLWVENREADSAAFDPHVVLSSNFVGIDVSAADVDGDGDLDLLAVLFRGSGLTPYLTPDSRLVWLENDGRSPPDFEMRTIDSSQERGHWSIYPADLDGDGDPDIVAALFVEGAVVWYECLR